MNTSSLTYRHLVHITLEAQTPLSIGSGEKDILSDSLIAKDANGLPYIPGTTLAGILRHAIGNDKAARLFGSKPDSSSGEGSRIIFSEGKIIGPEGNAIDGLQTIDWEDSFYKEFYNLPVRQHVRIGEKGTAEDAGKFDNQIIYKGTRFCFDIEILSSSSETEELEELLKQICSETFRIGGRSNSGLGEVKVISLKTKSLNLNDDKDLTEYLVLNSRLDKDYSSWNEYQPDTSISRWYRYDLDLTPEDFFIFGSGRSNDKADITPVEEKIIQWSSDGKPHFSTELILIPASSVKGALRHRTAYYINLKKGIFADKLEDEALKNCTCSSNQAVRQLFGYEDRKTRTQKRGNVLFSDIFINNQDVKKKLFNHVAIDRLTGGTIDGALFSEEVVYSKSRPDFHTSIYINPYGVDNDSIEAFEQALSDLCSGMLPLGNGTGRGHGCFKGKFTPNKNNSAQI